MKLVMTMVVRDEADIIEKNIKFHLEQGVNHFLVMDNASVDGTRDILEDLRRQNPITVIDEPGRDHSQSRWMTRLAKMAYEYLDADWVIPNDADEFWWNAGCPLQDAVRDQEKRETAVQLNCKRYNMISDFELEGSQKWWEHLVFRAVHPDPIPIDLAIDHDRKRAVPHFYCDLPGKVLLRADGIKSISQGNHTAEYAADHVARDCEIVIYHFPVRSVDQFISKSCNGGAAYERNTELPKRVGWHKRRWFWLYNQYGIEAALEDALPSPDRLHQDLMLGKLIEDKSMVEPLSD